MNKIKLNVLEETKYLLKNSTDKELKILEGISDFLINFENNKDIEEFILTRRRPVDEIFNKYIRIVDSKINVTQNKIELCMRLIKISEINIV